MTNTFDNFENENIDLNKINIKANIDRSKRNKEIIIHEEENIKNEQLIRKYKSGIFSSIWYGNEIKEKINKINVKTIDDNSIMKLIDLYSNENDTCLNLFTRSNVVKLIYQTKRKLINIDRIDIDSNSLQNEYKKYSLIYSDTIEPLFYNGNIFEIFQKINSESIDFFITTLTEINENYNKIISEIDRILKKNKIAIFIFKDSYQGMLNINTILDVILSEIKKQLNLSLMFVRILNVTQKENDLDRNALIYQWYNMCHTDHYYIIGVEKK